MFTDIEGSTRRWEADADGMRAALAVHDEALRKAIEVRGGWFVSTPAGSNSDHNLPHRWTDKRVALNLRKGQGHG